MKKLLLAGIATAALSLPALAQTTAQPNVQPPNQQQMQMGQPAANQPIGTTGQAAGEQGAMNQSPAMNQSQQTLPIKASALSQKQIEHIQMSLNKQGFSSHKVDGVWGPETETALTNFQQVKGLPGNGQLNKQTLQALGVNIAGNANAANAQNQQNGVNAQQPSAATTGQAVGESGPSAQEPNAEPGENNAQQGASGNESPAPQSSK